MAQDPNFLNVDEIRPSIAKTIRLGGVIHEFKVPSVEEFFDELQRTKKLKADFGDPADFKDRKDLSERMVEVYAEQVRHSVSMAFPTLKKTDVNKMTFQQLIAIHEFIKLQHDDESQDAKDSEGNA